MAHKKGLGSSRNGRDSNAKRLGVKVFAGQTVTGGEIIVRQRGTKFKPGNGVGIGRDDTIYARAAGTVDFKEGRRGRVISVVRPSRAAATDVGSQTGGLRRPSRSTRRAATVACRERPARSAVRVAMRVGPETLIAASGRPRGRGSASRRTRRPVRAPRCRWRSRGGGSSRGPRAAPSSVVSVRGVEARQRRAAEQRLDVRGSRHASSALPAPDVCAGIALADLGEQAHAARARRRTRCRPTLRPSSTTRFVVSPVSLLDRLQVRARRGAQPLAAGPAARSSARAACSRAGSARSPGSAPRSRARRACPAAGAPCWARGRSAAASSDTPSSSAPASASSRSSARSSDWTRGCGTSAVRTGSAMRDRTRCPARPSTVRARRADAAGRRPRRSSGSGCRRAGRRSLANIVPP